MTNYRIIGAGYTPVRAVIDKAAAFVDRPMACLALVVSYGALERGELETAIALLAQVLEE